MQEFLTQIEPALVSLAVAFVIAILGILAKLILVITPKIEAWLIAKIGRENFESAKNMATGIWLVLEKNYPQLDGQAKRIEMGNMLLKRFPSLTQDELDAINKEINSMLTWSTKVVMTEPCDVGVNPESEEVEFIAAPGPTEG